jgi:hypothetical protein
VLNFQRYQTKKTLDDLFHTKNRSSNDAKVNKKRENLKRNNAATQELGGEAKNEMNDQQADKKRQEISSDPSNSNNNIYVKKNKNSKNLKKK